MTSMPATGKKESRTFGMTLGAFVARFGALFGLVILIIVLSILSPVFLTAGQHHKHPSAGDGKLSAGRRHAFDDHHRRH